MKKALSYLLLFLISCAPKASKLPAPEVKPRSSQEIPETNFSLQLLQSSESLLSLVDSKKKQESQFDELILRGKEFLLQKDVLKLPIMVYDFDIGPLVVISDSELVATCRKILDALLQGQQKKELYAERWQFFLEKILANQIKERRLTNYRLGLPIQIKETDETQISVLLQSKEKRTIMTLFFAQHRKGWRLTEVQGDWGRFKEPSSLEFDPEEF